MLMAIATPVPCYGLKDWEGTVASRPWELASGDTAVRRRRLQERGRRQPAGDAFGAIQTQLRDELSVVRVVLDGEIVMVQVDPQRGPRWGLEDDDFVDIRRLQQRGSAFVPNCTKDHWWQLSPSEKEHLLILVARKMVLTRSRWNARLGTASQDASADGAANRGPAAISEDALEDARRQAQERCARELAKPSVTWNFITVQTVTENHDRAARGMFYGLEFPWTEAMLDAWGPKWLTKAFHASGVLEASNAVTRINMKRQVKVTTGNNGGKFLFDVVYAHSAPGLHTKLFAKVPFQLDGATRSDRLSSSVNKQPQEFYEINTSRLLEGTLPVRIPKFYFGDISNETSNWILITECIPFTASAGINFGKPNARKKPLGAYHIEGPYDKCLDHNLRGDPREYYLRLARAGAMIAGMDKAGKLGSEEALKRSFGYVDVNALPLRLDGCSGEDPKILSKKIEVGLNFIRNTGGMLFPDSVTTEAFLSGLTEILLTLNAYSLELLYWKHMDKDYVALTHQNLNVDNAYFWRNDTGELELGVFDWGGMESRSVGHKLWWWIYCSDFEFVREHLGEYIQVFMRSYEEYGGPVLDSNKLDMMVKLTAMEQMLGLIAAVPQIMKMCPLKEWSTIKNRYDPRISENVDGKSTLRLYLHCMHSILCMVKLFDGRNLLDTWICDQYAGSMGQTPKAASMIGLPDDSS